MAKVIRKYLCSRCKKRYDHNDINGIIFIYDYSLKRYRKCCEKCFDEIRTKNLISGHVNFKMDFYIKEWFMKTLS